jgi:hypothetical protein
MQACFSTSVSGNGNDTTALNLRIQPVQEYL